MTITHAIARLRQIITDHRVTQRRLAEARGETSVPPGWVLMRESELDQIVEALDPQQGRVAA